MITSRAVKTLRLCLLLLMAVLLPVRGAVAAAWPCAGEGLHQAAVQASVAVHAHHAGRVMAQVHEPSAAIGHAGPHHHDGHGGDGRCNVCASCCSTAPMVATFTLSIAAPAEPPARFPALRASATTFVSEGQERPPRSV